MRKTIIHSFVLSFLIAGLPAGAATYKEAGGKVVVEAEHYDARTNSTTAHRWSVIPDESGTPDTPVDPGFANARGGKYVQSLPDNAENRNANTGVVGTGNTIDYKVQINNVGQYRLYLRWGGFDGASDSMYAEIVELRDGDGGQPDWYRYSANITGDFANARNTGGGGAIGWNGSGAPAGGADQISGGPAGEVPAVWTISTAGTYTIRLSQREDGSAVDALILQRSDLPFPEPTDPGPAESAIVGAPDTTPLTLVNAVTAGNPNGLLVIFSKAVSPSTATNKANYTINNGVTVNSAVIFRNDFTVLLTTTTIAPGQSYQVTINGVQDTATPPNTIAANTRADFLQVGGVIERRVFTGIGGTTIANLTNSPAFIADQPNLVTYPTLFETPGGFGDNYGVQLRGYLTAPVTGSYVFFMFSDDAGVLFLSTDDTPARRLIATETVWSNSRQWQSSGGASVLTEKRSDTYSASQWPTPNVINLTAGRRYYIEALMKEGGGGDFLGVTWVLPGGSEPVDGDPPIPGQYLSPFTTPGPIAITTQPVGLTVNEPLPAVFTVVATGSPPYSYQWFRNGTAIPNANSATYTRSPTLAADNGAKFKVEVSNPFSGQTSSEVTLNVIADTESPVLYRAVGSPTLNQVTVTFSEAADATATNLANFSIPGLTISGSARSGNLGTGGTNVVLTTSLQTTGSVYTVTVKDIKDLAGKALTPNPSTVSFTAFTLSGGAVLHKFFAANPANNIAGLTNRADFPNSPTFTTLEPLFEYGPNGSNESGENYGNQLTALLKAPVTGDYVFFITSDDPGRLYLSTDDTPANKRLIASVNSWSDARLWVSGGNALVEDRRSDTFSASEWPTPNVITLTAGKFYYIEAIHTEGGGGDNVGVNWTLPGGTDPANGTPPISGTNLFVLQNPDQSTATISITSPANNATIATGSNIPITVNAVDAKGPIRRVDFLANGAVIGSSSTSPFSFTWNSVAEGRYAVIARVLDRYGYFINSTAVNVAVGNVAPLAVVFTSATPSAADNAAVARLKTLGFDTKVVADTLSQTSDANGAALLVISSTVGSGNIGTKFTASAVPIVSWESALWDELGMEANNINGATVAGQTDLEIVDATHPLAAGLTAGVKTVYTVGSDMENVTDLIPSGIVVARLTDGTARPTIFAVEKGAALNPARIATAPARRVGLYVVDTFLNTNDDGKKLFDAAVKWAANLSAPPPGQPKFNAPTISGANVTISWTGTGTLEQADAVSGPWTNAPNQNNPQTVAAAGTKFYRLRAP